MKTKEQLIDELIDLAFAEDIGDGDHTTLCCIPDTAMGKSRLLIKEPGILAGVEIARKIFHRFDPDLKMTVYIEDGTAVKPGDVAFVVEGRVQSLLQTERLMLNVMQRMSGIATMTHRYVKKLEGLHTRILDTRKTTPGMRMLEKEAVKIGGGVNHRIGLFDMILLKDNHVDFAGGIENAISRCHDYLKAKRLIFVIGGPYGFSQRIYNAAQEKISLSKMTFSHQMIRLIFTEQLYRAMTILNNEPYHHE